MNLTHLRYAVEIGKTKSISKAASNLFMAQPNLSRAIKELEDSLGVTLFDRTSKGIVITPHGEEFINNAEKILKQVNYLENIFSEDMAPRQKFSIAVPRSSYISYAFAQFSKKVNSCNSSEFFYKETSSDSVINNLLHSDYNLGIIRYASNFDAYFKEMLNEKNITYTPIAEFSYVIVMSKHHPLANKKEIKFCDLYPYTEISHGDPQVPSLPLSAVKKEELPDEIQKRIFVFERASQFDILTTNYSSFMWISPMPASLIDKLDLVQKKCVSNNKKYKDVLIYKKGYHLTELDKLFIEELDKSKNQHLII